ncbi:MAG: histidine--tRNA ligase [Hyphomicrobium sp.]|nr:MAG: histidine--tRNA ligase [Hyphomicrobium sp.]
MSKSEKDARPNPAQAPKQDVSPSAARPSARIAKGFRDIEAAELKGLNEMLSVIRGVYETYGFEALETPALEYTDALGKFLPDQERPNAGVFSFQDEDDQWMSLRYDLTAPLARYVAQNMQTLPKPFRRYAYGNVYRNEKPGPGRFRQFMQFDADTVGSDSIAADAEMCMLAADTLEALGVKRGDYVIKVNSRKVLDGLRDATEIDSDSRWLSVMRALDKFDRLGRDGVALLLGSGRKDESGDFTPGAGLDEQAIFRFLQLLTFREKIDDAFGETKFLFNPVITTSEPGGPLVPRSLTSTIAFGIRHYVEQVQQRDIRTLVRLESGLSEIENLGLLIHAAGYDDGRIVFDPSVVRGLEYYTGPVFEAELTFEVKGDDGKPVRFGSVGGGGRYDDLVSRFTGERVPATGFSIGVSRLQAALALIKDRKQTALGPVVVLVMDKPEIAAYQRLTQTLRDAGIRAEMYLGSSGMKAQMKYADKRNAPCVIIQGSDERAKGEVTIKDLIEGAKAAAAIKDNKEWKEQRPAQLAVAETQMVDEVRKIIARHQD